MKFICNDLVYDTEKAILLHSGVKQWKTEIFTGTVYVTRPTYLYKTCKGNYFFVFKGDWDKYYMKPCSEVEAKTWLKYSNYDKYAELFGALEEA